MLIKLAWRNLFRNTRRTVLSGLAIGIGLAGLILMDAMVRGELNEAVLSATATFPGQAQIHHRDFRRTLAVEATLAEPDRVLAELAQEPLVKAFAPRVLSYAMLSSPADASSVLLYGIDPQREAAVSQLALARVKGHGLDPAEPSQILIGKRLAENLGVDLGDRMVITVAQAGTGELSQEMFRVAGIFELKIREMDQATAFISLAKAQQLLRLGSGIHEIAVVFKDLQTASDPRLPFWKQYSRGSDQALGWGALFPDLLTIADVYRVSLFMMALIVFGIVSFGIMNTLFMSLYERMFEFGVLRAIGTRPGRLAGVILFEAGFLAGISSLMGVLLGLLITLWLQRIGVDYSGLEFNGVAFRNLLFPVLHWSQYVLYPVALIAFTVLVGSYPALYAARLTPAKAMQRTL